MYKHLYAPPNTQTSNTPLTHPSTEAPPIQLILGRTSFYIPSAFLSHSRHLTSLLTHNTSAYPTIYIPDTNPSHFRIYASFICSNTLQIPCCERCTTNPTNPKNCIENFWSHRNGCYELGWKLEDTPFRNKLIDVAIWQMINCDEMPDSLHETIYKNSKKGSMYRTLVLNLAFNRWDKRELKRVEASEFRDDLFKYLSDALRADGVERKGVQDVLSGMPQGVHWEREGDYGEERDGEERDGDGGVKVEEDTEVEDYTGVEDRTDVQDYTKVEDYTDGGGETEDNAETEVMPEIETEIKTEIEADIETKQESELESEAETEYFPSM
jgi:hypothetical protein